MRIDTKAISVSFVAWQLQNLEKIIIAVTKKPKNFLINIANIFKSILKILKVLN